MTNVDQFESVFRSASKEVFEYELLRIDTVLLITDRTDQGAETQFNQMRNVLSVLSATGEPPRFELLSGIDDDSVEGALSEIDACQPQLVCTHRQNQLPAGRHPYTLGNLTGALTQATSVPVLIMPDPGQHSETRSIEPPRSVMAMTDHLAGDSHLVNFAACFTMPQGTLFLSHVEDESVFDRYLSVISKITTIETDAARDDIREQLLKEPQDFIQTCQRILKESNESMNVESIVIMGYHLSEYRRLIDEHRVDLLVMNTKDEDQLAMHGLAYPLAIEMRDLPLLML